MVITGRFVVLLASAGMPLLLSPTRLTALWCALAVLAIAIADRLLAPDPRKIDLQRTTPSSVRLGEEATVTLSVRSGARRTVRLRLRDAWPPSAGAVSTRHRMTLRPEEHSEVQTILRPVRRGDRQAAGVTVRSHTVLGVIARQITVEVPATLRVLPPFRSSRHLPSKIRQLREAEGRSTVQVRGQGTEFDSLRDYVPGDDVRSIDWRATARRRHVVVRTWRPERDRRVVIVLDSGRLSATRVEGETRFEASVEATLLLSALADHSGDRIDVIVADRRVRARVHPTGRMVLADVVGAIAPIEPELWETDWSLVASTIAATTRQRAFVVVLTELESAALADGLIPILPLLTDRHQVAVASVADPAVKEMAGRASTQVEAYDAASAAKALADREALRQVLTQANVDSVDTIPEQLAPKLADLYIALKATGRL